MIIISIPLLLSGNMIKDISNVSVNYLHCYFPLLTVNTCVEIHHSFGQELDFLHEILVNQILVIFLPELRFIFSSENVISYHIFHTIAAINQKSWETISRNIF